MVDLADADKNAPSPRLLIVDDDDQVREVISILLSDEGYTCVCAASADEALERASEGFDLTISDMKMPVHDGLWLIDRMVERYPEIGVIMLTGFGETENAVECLRRGAIDYLLKPPRMLDMVRAIERALSRLRLERERKLYQSSLEQRVREKTAALSAALNEIGTAYNNTLLALVQALDAREHETSDHSMRVVRYTLAIAAHLKLSEAEKADIARGALLHDIGKIGVPDAILLKPGPLTPSEWDEMRRHAAVGHSILSSIPFLAGPAKLVLCHHERFDGKGYPNGLAGEEIPLGARIFSIADSLDAITSDRPYRAKRSFEEARSEIENCAGKQFQPELVRAFLSIGAEELATLRSVKGYDLLSSASLAYSAPAQPTRPN